MTYKLDIIMYSMLDLLHRELDNIILLYFRGVGIFVLHKREGAWHLVPGWLSWFVRLKQHMWDIKWRCFPKWKVYNFPQFPGQYTQYNEDQLRARQLHDIAALTPPRPAPTPKLYRWQRSFVKILQYLEKAPVVGVPSPKLISNWRQCLLYNLPSGD